MATGCPRPIVSRGTNSWSQLQYLSYLAYQLANMSVVGQVADRQPFDTYFTVHLCTQQELKGAAMRFLSFGFFYKSIVHMLLSNLPNILEK